MLSARSAKRTFSAHNCSACAIKRYIYTYIYIYIYLCVFVCVCVCVCIYTYIYIHIYTYTYIGRSNDEQATES